MSGLVGFYERSLDEKGRLVLPPELRSRLDPEVFISRWYDSGLALFSENEYTRFAESLHNQGSHDTQTRSARREIFGGACLVGIDKQGRMTVPERLLDGLLLDPVKDRDLVLLGDWNKVLIHSGLRYRDLARKDQVNLDEALSNVERVSGQRLSGGEGVGY
jgi:MraZ protein